MPVPIPLSLPTLHEATVQYGFEHARPMPTLRWSRIRANTRVSRQIAQLYKAAPLVEDEAMPAYKTLHEETQEQFDFLIRPVAQGGLGLRVKRQFAEPYRLVDELVAELCTERTVRIAASILSGRPHPFFTRDEQDMFRVTHLVFGHAVIQRGFDRDGAEAAWLRHSTALSPLARRAMTTETRAQACALMYATGSSRPPLKAMVLPPIFSSPEYEAWR